jgi:hypothetical protein
MLSESIIQRKEEHRDEITSHLQADWNYTAGIILISLLGYAAETDIIINEIHYYPKSDLQEEEYVELYNRGSQPSI